MSFEANPWALLSCVTKAAYAGMHYPVEGSFLRHRSVALLLSVSYDPSLKIDSGSSLTSNPCVRIVVISELGT